MCKPSIAPRLVRVVRVGRRLTLATKAGALAMGSIAGPATAAAQPLGAAPERRVSLAAGLDGFLRDGSEATPQLAVHAGYDLRPAGAGRVGLRLGADYTTRRYGPSTVRVNGEPVGTVDRDGRSQVYGAVLLGTVRFTGARGAHLRPGRRGRLRAVRTPARAGGAGLRATRLGPALSAGLGLEAPTRGLTVFGEARATYLTNGIGGAPRGGRAVVVPLVAGVRF
jgi:hypothetical protein